MLISKADSSEDKQSSSSWSGSAQTQITVFFVEFKLLMMDCSVCLTQNGGELFRQDLNKLDP